MMTKKKLVLFDLDGVLIDSKSNMRRSWECVIEEFALTVPFETYFSNIGRPFVGFFQLLVSLSTNLILKGVITS